MLLQKHFIPLLLDHIDRVLHVGSLPGHECLGDLQRNQVIQLQRDSCDRALASLGDMLGNKGAFEDMACLLGDDGVEHGVARESTVH